jgi:four helix bundle protein
MVLREGEVNYEEWILSVPEEVTGDSVWKMEAYRLSMFLADIGWGDITKLMSDRRTLSLSDQLYRSLGSISANLAEGYSRSSNKDRARFYDYALGSARESRGWYYQSRFILNEKIVTHRLRLVTQVIRLLLTMIPQQRGYTMQENQPSYLSDSEDHKPTDRELLDQLMTDIPLPN